MDKIKVLHQVLDPSGAGGVSAEFRALKNSSLSQKYEFNSMILTDFRPGLNLHDILFYYKQIKDKRPDIVHIRGAAIDGLNAVIAARLAGNCKVLTTVHGMYSDLVFISPIKRWISKNVIERAIYSLSHGISCVCKNAANRTYFNKYREKMLPFVYNRMPSYDRSKKNEMRTLIESQYNIEKDSIICSFVGRMTREKGLLTLEHMFEKYSDSLPSNLIFLFVGDGDYKEQFEHNIKKYNIKSLFLGMQKDVCRFYLSSDFFIQPSLHENHSIALLEACSAGIPSVATDCGGNTEIVTDRQTGRIVPIDNVKEIYLAIIELCDRDVLEKYTKNVEKRDYSQFSMSSCDKMLDDVYQKLIRL